MLEQHDLKIQIAKIIEERDWTKLCIILEERFKINPNAANSLHLPSDEILTLCDLLTAVKKLLSEDNDSLLKVLKNVYKALRNAVAYNSDAQTFLSNHPYVLSDTIQILHYLKLVKDQYGLECMKMLLQFLINLIVNNIGASQKVWNAFSGDIKDLISQNICLYHTSALTYNIFHMDEHLLQENDDIIPYILNAYRQSNTNEYLTFLLELFIKNVHLNKMYIGYNAEQRILSLEMMKDMLNTDKSWVTEELIIILCREFKQKSDCILKTVTDYLKQIEPLEVTLLLELLASISSDENFVKYMQKDKSLLINCAFLLKSIHSVGKEAENNFSVIPKLSQLDNTDMDILQHPSYGFKASTIRLLANLCWQNKSNQDELRKLDCIPLLLDCCNIDARNPFIIQWVIFAIRILCENNTENQEVIAAMNQQGVVSSAALLEMGITLHSDEQHSIKIVPLDLKK